MPTLIPPILFLYLWPLAVLGSISLAVFLLARHDRGSRTSSPSSKQAIVIADLDQTVDRLAHSLATDVLHYDFQGLRPDGSVLERGFPLFAWSSIGGQKFQGTQNDLRDLARKLLLDAISTPTVDTKTSTRSAS